MSRDLARTAPMDLGYARPNLSQQISQTPLILLLLCGYMWLFIHRPFEVWPWLGSYRIERIYMLLTIGVWLLSGSIRLVPGRLNGAFALFAMAVLSAWMMSPYHEVGTRTVEDYLKVAVFYVLVITSVRSERDLRILVLGFVVAVGLYMCHSLREYINGRNVWRMGTARMIGVDITYRDPNTFAATLIYALPMSFPFWREAQTFWQRLPWLAYGTLTATCILLTGSRTGLIGLCFLALLFGIFVARQRLRIVLFALVLAPIAWGLLPEDRQRRFLTIIDPSYGPQNALASAQGRLEGWHDGVRLWQDNPLFGVGPAAFGSAIGHHNQSHQLYAQVLSELGAVGAVAFAAVLVCYALNLHETRMFVSFSPTLREQFSYHVSKSVCITVALLLVMGLGGHNLFRYTWLWYGAFQTIALYCLQRQLLAQLENEQPVEERELAWNL